VNRIGFGIDMSQIFQRFSINPLLVPHDFRPSHEGLVVQCVFNPGAFRFDDKTWLLLRVAERPVQEPDMVSIPVISHGKINILKFSKKDPDVDSSDPRIVICKGRTFLTTLSHFRLACSEDGLSFQVSPHPPIRGDGPLETFGVEDCRVVLMDGIYYLTYSAVSDNGYGVGLMSTSDWRTIHRHGMILSGPNKDCAIFPGKIAGEYWCLHRPCGQGLGGNFIWTARSKDLLYWGNHQCLAWTREGMWDSGRIGAGASPIKTPEGWLVLYHGADLRNRYCLGAMLLDLKDPSRVLVRTRDPIMEPAAEYETKGFFGNVVFNNGHIVEGDRIYLYYGASDETVCGAQASIVRILDVLNSK
jgi:predicted GH43/DUF377 family glycosyl hydrolase